MFVGSICNSDQTQSNSNKKNKQQLPEVYIRLPYIDNPGTYLRRKTLKLVLRICIRIGLALIRFISVDQPDSQGLHLRYPRYGEDPDTGWSRGTQILCA